jgi:hypothetical protein
MPRRAVVVHSLAHAVAALKAAAEAGAGVTLVSAPAAAGYLGPGVFREMIAEARRRHPDVPVRAVLDCGDEPGFALAAFRSGIEAVRVDVPPDVRRRLADIARKSGAVLDDGRAPALDLLDCADPYAAAKRWLAEGG